MNKMENILENKKEEMTAFEILKKVRTLDNADRDKEAEDLENRAKKAGLDFSDVHYWEARNPELPLGQLLEEAEIDPNQKFEI